MALFTTLCACWCRSEFDFCTQLDESSWIDFEEVGRSGCVLHHPNEDRLTPHRHLWDFFGNQGLSGHEEGGLHGRAIDVVLLPEQIHDLSCIRGFFEAIDCADDVDVFVKLLDRESLIRIDFGHVPNAQFQKDHLFMQYMVVLQVVKERGRHKIDVCI